MSRVRLSSRRESEVVAFVHKRIAYTGSVSTWPDGPPCEVFLDGGKAGTAVQHVVRDCAVAASLALQYGAPLETLRAAMTRHDDNAAAGPLGKLLDLAGSKS